MLVLVLERTGRPQDQVDEHTRQIEHGYQQRREDLHERVASPCPDVAIGPDHQRDPQGSQEGTAERRQDQQEIAKESRVERHCASYPPPPPPAMPPSVSLRKSDSAASISPGVTGRSSSRCLSAPALAFSRATSRIAELRARASFTRAAPCEYPMTGLSAVTTMAFFASQPSAFSRLAVSPATAFSVNALMEPI